MLLCLLMLIFCACDQRETPPPSPTATAAPQMPTFTLAPPTATPMATSTPVATSTPPPPTSTASPTPSPTATGSPTPTVPPAQRMPTAETLRRFGDYERAVAEYAAILTSYPWPDLAAEALFGLGETYFQQGDYHMAIDVLSHFIQDYPQSKRLADVLYRLAVAHQKLGDWPGALAYYKRYIEAQERIPPSVHAHLGEVYARLGQTEAATASYERALASDPPPAFQGRWREELASLYRQAGRTDEAVGQYERVLELTSYAPYKARLLYEIGLTLQEAGRIQEALERYRQVMERYPEEQSAYQALVALLDSGVEDIDPLQRGIVNYHVGQYRLCADILEAYLAGAPESEAKASLGNLYLGLAQRQLGEVDAALKTFGRIIARYPESEWAPAALYQRAYTWELANEDEHALADYHLFTARHPDHVLADDAMWQQAGLLAALRRNERAAAMYRALAITFPNSPFAERARFQSGLVHYRAGEYLAAAQAWRGAAQEDLPSSEQARLLCWSGKAWAAAGETREAQIVWEEAVQVAPDSFYGLRSAALLEGTAPELVPNPLDAHLYDPATYVAEDESAEVIAWLQALTGSPGQGADWDEVRRTMRDEAAYRNGRTLLASGAREDALAEFDRLRDQLRDQPLALYALAWDLHTLGLYRPASACVDRIVTLAEVSSLKELPTALLRLAYPAQYVELIAAEARQYDLDPRLFLALIRQESRFDAQATSYAGARGLSQVMPATGEWIAMMLGQRRFRPDDLYRPQVNVRYGLWYLAWARELFDGDLLAALAGYNGGPGNVKMWAGGVFPIQDVEWFVESIALAETKAYVMAVWEQYAVYRWLYP